MTTPQDPFAAPDPNAQPQQPQQQWGAPPPGYSAPPPGWQPAQQGTNGFAIAALVTAFLCAPLAVVFGVVARKQIKRTGQPGDGLALAGIIIGIIGIVLSIAWFAAAGSMVADDPTF